MTFLCATRPPEWWETGDPGNRLAVGLCGVCPGRDRCAAGSNAEAGVIRAGVAYTVEGRVALICHCGYPDDRRHDPRRPARCCRWCELPKVRNWSRRQYWKAYYQRRRRKPCPAA